jgi:hypothetical protein
MNSYNYSLSKRYTKIIFIQTFWRKYKLSQILQQNINLNLGSLILNNILKNNLNHNIIYILFKDTKKELCICNKKIEKYINIFKLLIKTSIILKYYNIYQLKQNIYKLIFLYTINQSISDIDKLYINIENLESLTNNYISISNQQINDKFDILKKILNLHILKTEEILMEYNNFGHQLVYDYIKKININTYYIIYNKFIQTHHITNKNFNHKEFYNKLITFLDTSNIFNFLFINSIDINYKKLKNFNDRIYLIESIII